MEKSASLKGLLKSAGKKNFVKYFDNYNLKDITKDGSIKNESAITIINACHKIFKQGLQKEVFEWISNSTRVELEYVEKAKKLLEEFKWQNCDILCNPCRCKFISKRREVE